MKFLTLLLVTTILFLVSWQDIGLISSETNIEQHCCGEQCQPIADNEKSSNQQEKKDECSGKFCNPFQVCCPYVIQFLTNPSFDLSNPEISLIQYSTYRSTFISQFISDFWRPPKTV